MRFELQRTQLLRYWRWGYLLGLVFTLLPLALMAIPIMLKEEVTGTTWLIVYSLLILPGLAFLAFLRWYATQMAASLAYQLVDDVLHIDEGVFTYKRKAIPLDRVTDIRLVQGILMRWLGIWRIDIQTASVGQTGAEGILWAVEGPKEVRSKLLEARQRAVQTAT
ncbi:MAG: PH domain-containing protein [Anaerolineales bacterium]|nr:PH domain-containing protein [Anaerolineales bacterium]MCB0011936.1 PH domain-containing protein [Anaerolineales bacterium]MCB0016861.1 PH domain-containing protein [Anaerolineales bacterium]MCB0031510.1 PH domain-containing protein [Anaerolineales bacterium]MCB8962284.1 PH domain-containing protein [Ardenticatenales bacterium]